MPSADFCRPVRFDHSFLSPVSRTDDRSPEVSSTTFDAQPPDLHLVSLMDMRFAVTCQLARHPMPLSGSCSSARVFAPRFFQTLRRRNALALRYPSPPSGWKGDSHPASRQTCSAHKKRRATFVALLRFLSSESFLSLPPVC